jgi:hypothetical protein
VGVNGTSHSFPQSEHTVFVMVRGPDDDGPPYFFWFMPTLAGITLCKLAIDLRFIYKSIACLQAISWTIRPSRKMEIFPPLWETTIPTAPVTWVMPAIEECRVPSPLGIPTVLVSMVM